MNIVKLFILTMIAVILMFSESVYAVELSKTDMYWLTQNVYWEARGQSKKGQALVALVTINRMKDGRWPNTIKGVVTQPYQFAWYSDGNPDIPKNKKAWNKATKVAEIICSIYDTLDPAYKRVLHFHEKNVDPHWKRHYVKFESIQNHVFYID